MVHVSGIDQYRAVKTSYHQYRPEQTSFKLGLLTLPCFVEDLRCMLIPKQVSGRPGEWCMFWYRYRAVKTSYDQYRPAQIRFKLALLTLPCFVEDLRCMLIPKQASGRPGEWCMFLV